MIQQSEVNQQEVQSNSSVSADVESGFRLLDSFREDIWEVEPCSCIRSDDDECFGFIVS